MCAWSLKKQTNKKQKQKQIKNNKQPRSTPYIWEKEHLGIHPEVRGGLLSLDSAWGADG